MEISDLKASYEHRIRWGNEDTKNSLSAYIFWNMDQNGLLESANVFNAQTGGNISYPVNINDKLVGIVSSKYALNQRIGRWGFILQGEGRYDNELL